MTEDTKRIPKRRFKEFENADAWEQRKLGEIGTVVTGSTPSTDDLTNYSDDGMPWVTPTDIKQNITYDTNKKLSAKGQKNARIVPKNTILLTCIASIGKNTLLGTVGSFNQQINGLVPDFKEHDPYFLLTESKLWSDRMKVQASSGTMQIVTKTEFSLIETLIPSLDEQKHIGNYFSKLDNLITLHQRKLEKLKNLKTAYLTEMFPAEGERKPKRRFAGFTDDWEQRKLGSIAKLINRVKPSSKAPVMMISANNGFIKQSERYSYENAGQSLKKYILLKKDELAYNHGASKIRPYGSCFVLREQEARVPFVYHCFSVQENDPRFLEHELNSHKIEKQLKSLISSGARMDGLLNISFQEYNSVQITIPSLKEQERIGDFFQKLDYLITLHQRKLDKLQNLKKSYLHEMFI